jgi:DNA polymerase
MIERQTGLAVLDCSLCGLSRGRTQVVPAEGDRAARVMLVGEAPGPDEDRVGRPFIGRAGKVLRRELANAGWRPEDVWITNTVKCFPFDLVESKKKIRPPTGLESDACRLHLRRELDALRPRLIVALGRTAAQQLTGEPVPSLETVRGATLATRAALGDYPVFVTYHPSGLHYAAGRLELFQADLRRARTIAAADAAP